MISRDVDLNKARTLLYYLSRSKTKIDERALARKKLEIKLKQLKKISTGSIQKHLDELEQHISDTIQKERKILKGQIEEESVHKTISEKIDILETKLEKYLQTKEARQKRIQQLENKIKGQLESKQDKIKEISKHINLLEKLYKETSKTKKAPKARLNTIKKKIDILKEKLKNLQNK